MNDNKTAKKDTTVRKFSRDTDYNLTTSIYHKTSGFKGTYGMQQSTFYTNTRTGHISATTEENLSPAQLKDRPMMASTHNQINPQLYQKNIEDIFDMPDDGLDCGDDVIEEDMDEIEDDLDSVCEKIADLKIFSKSSLNEDLEAIAQARKSKTAMGPNFELEPRIPRRKYFTDKIVYLDEEIIEKVKARSLTGQLE